MHILKTFSKLPFYLFIYLFGLFAISWAIPTAYGGSQARGPIGAEPPVYARATATRDPSLICNLHHSSQQRRILNPLSNLMVPSQIRQPLRHGGNSLNFFLNDFYFSIAAGLQCSVNFLLYSPAKSFKFMFYSFWKQ